MAEELELAGGNAADFVLRVGQTIRKPWAASTESVQQFLTALRLAGVEVPRPLGRDEQGRQVIEFVDGTLAMDSGQLNSTELRKVGEMIRIIHDNSPKPTPADLAQWKVLIPAPKPDLICHNDLAPWNLILGERMVFIDWDGSGPSSRLWDLAYAAQSFSGLWAGTNPEEARTQLRAFVDGYRADEQQRRALPETMVHRVQAMYELLKRANCAGEQPWAAMFDQGHGAHWKATAEYVAEHLEIWREALIED
ncbi:phosphotransferase [Psychromicrobium lacuslunae]|uniref:Aminoglycoside phosphotransferase n=1 Tax=Psychromicrobium lacuslunae TaxID=1618207 RepID=A0A0D4BZ80_9MICC|nr:phosphotransferase [Psychromicrobium lacuslunae]AJT41628.1 aminoglycoside phosphotransferase [Psychromicrobium lacuslunae]